MTFRVSGIKGIFSLKKIQTLVVLNPMVFFLDLAKITGMQTGILSSMKQRRPNRLNLFCHVYSSAYVSLVCKCLSAVNLSRGATFER